MIQRIEKIKEMLQQSPQDCFLHHALGLEYIKAGQTQDALLEFRRVLSINEEYVGTYYHLARLLFADGQKEEALSTFRKGIEVASKLKDLHARNELQMALEELEDE